MTDLNKIRFAQICAAEQEVINNLPKELTERVENGETANNNMSNLTMEGLLKELKCNCGTREAACFLGTYQKRRNNDLEFRIKQLLDQLRPVRKEGLKKDVLYGWTLCEQDFLKQVKEFLGEE